MSVAKTAVSGIYHSGNQARRSVDNLLTAGFANDDISVLFPDSQGFQDLAPEENTMAPEVSTARGALVGMGIPEHEAKHYEGHIKVGGVLVSARSDTTDEVAYAKDLLKQRGAKHISSSGEATADYLAGGEIPTYG